MNKKVAQILGIGHMVIDSLGPAGQAATAAAEAIIKAVKTPGKADDLESTLELLSAITVVLEACKLEFAQEPLFQSSLYQVKAGAMGMYAAVEQHKKQN